MDIVFRDELGTCLISMDNKTIENKIDFVDGVACFSVEYNDGEIEEHRIPIQNIVSIFTP